MAFIDQSAGKRPQNAAWYIALIVILLAALVIWAALSLRIDLFTEVLKQDDAVAILIVVDDGESPALTSLVGFDSKTLNGAVIAVPKETGALLNAVDRVDRLEVLYDVANLQTYSDAVEELLGLEIDFTIRFHLDDFERLVDHLGGLDIFIPNAVDDEVDGQRFLFPPGGVNLDGAKVRSYIEYRPAGEHIDERTDREHRLIQSLLRRLGENLDRLLSEAVFPYVFELVSSDLDQRSLETFLTTIEGIDTDRLVFQGILGNRRILDGKDVLFPYYDGKLVKETVQRIFETLGRIDEYGDDLLTVRVEIRNGTSVNGLASRTAQVFQSYGFRVVSITNAERDDYERTVVLDRRGNPEATRRVAELIRCEQIHSRIEEDRDETVDVTIILGKDFDGRYVKK